MEIVLLLLMYQLKPSAACLSQGTTPRPQPRPNDSFKKTKNCTRALISGPPSTRKTINGRVGSLIYKQKVADLEAKEQEAVDNDLKDWDHKPQKWTMLSPGRDYKFNNDDPPPSAVVPQNHGKPHFCFIPAVRGTCRGYYNRWGFNPLTGSCEQFVFSGCGGNENNFITYQRCKEACLNTPARDSNCENYRRRDGTILIGKPGCD